MAVGDFVPIEPPRDPSAAWDNSFLWASRHGGTHTHTPYSFSYFFDIFSPPPFLFFLSILVSPHIYTLTDTHTHTLLFLLQYSYMFLRLFEMVGALLLSPILPASCSWIFSISIGVVTMTWTRRHTTQEIWQQTLVRWASVNIISTTGSISFLKCFVFELFRTSNTLRTKRINLIMLLTLDKDQIYLHHMPFFECTIGSCSML